MSKGVTPQVPKLPPVFERMVRWFYLSFAGMAALPLVQLWPGAMSSISASGIPTMAFSLAVMSGPLLMGLAIQGRAVARIRRAVEASYGHSCLACVYDLRGLGDTGTCPECGHLFCIDRDRKTWIMAGCHYNPAMYRSAGPTFAPIPPAVKRQLWWLALPALLLAAAVTALLVFNLGNSASLPSDTETLLYAAAILAAFVLAIAVSTRRQRHGLRAAKASAVRACVVCNQDLGHLPATGTCPTCNRSVDTAADQSREARATILD